MNNILDIETSAAIIIRNQNKKESFFLIENKTNGYSDLLRFELDKDGYLKQKQKPKKITIPTCDIVGEQLRIC